MTDICDVLQAIVDLVCDDTDNVKSITTPYTGVGAVSSSDWTNLEPLLDSVKSKTDTIFSPVNPPSYTPYDIGSPSIYDPDGKSTNTLGDDACERARAAYERACGDQPPHHESSANALRDVVVIIDALRTQADPG